MGDRMTPIPFGELMNWVLTEKKQEGKVFGIRTPFKAGDKKLSLFTEQMETPFGPAAGPHTQLAQNIIASYYTGSRFFELKTVQILDGEDLPVNKPCILADDECYNCEWSTELYVPQAFDEYVKAWFALKLLSKEWGLGDENGFIFNMSVGYDLEGIKSEKVNTFIEGLKNAENTSIWKECKEYALNHLDKFKNIDKAYVESISPVVCTSGTLSTLHGCPPQEIERIASYLIEEKGLNTFIKCNPTLLGFETARKLMDDMGYDYVAFGDFHFKDDLQFEDAVPMLQRLQKLADEKGLKFGVKLTNTFPVDVTRNELPSEEMYMSGKSLYALTLAVAKKLSDAFDGKLRISYSGGADFFNIDKIFALGIWPITMATTVLKPGGYQRFTQIAEKLYKEDYKEFTGVDVKGLDALLKEAMEDNHHRKAVKPLPVRKLNKQVPLLDCFTAPCSEGCPIHQDIPAYMELVEQGRYEEALTVILDKNPLPFITGTICSHRCMSKCTRNFYEEPVHIRGAKLVAAEKGIKAEELIDCAANTGKKAAVVGGGPAGMAVAYFLARGGVKVTIFEKLEKLGGVVRNVIPEFRIAGSAIDKDVELLEKLGVEIRTNTRVKDIKELKEEGYDVVILAIGAEKKGEVKVEGAETVNALTFLADCKENLEAVKPGKNVVIIGGGNTAMDAARMAKRVPGVEKVSLVYRRNKRNMPADAEELELAIEDGVEFLELLAPKKAENGVLICDVMKLGEADESGRQKPVATGETTEVLADTIIGAVGEQVDDKLFVANGIKTGEKGRAVVNPLSLESSEAGVYVVGDGLNGPATVVEGIRDARMAADDILKKLAGKELASTEAFAKAMEAGKADYVKAAAKKAALGHAASDEKDGERCLSCNTVCECCVDVCPNRANVAIVMENGSVQIIHVDRMCNECGNCKSFCPYASAPYKDKFTLFHTKEDFENSTNNGFLSLGDGKVLVRLGAVVKEHSLKISDGLDEGIKALILRVWEKYSYL